MREAIAGLASQLRWAIDVPVPAIEPAEEVVVCGVGGSMHAGDIAALVAQQTTSVVHLHRTYDLPIWVESRRPLIVAVSYSGNTEETLSSLNQADQLGLDIAVVTSGGEIGQRAESNGWPRIVVPGGLPPRVAVGYQAGSVLRLLHGAGVVPSVHAGLTEAADMVDAQVSDSSGLAADLAEALEHRIPVILGGYGVGALAAGRWKTQINENAKLPAFAAEIPEANHNDLEGWAGGAASQLSLVALHDSLDHARVTRRLEKTLTDLAPLISVAGRVDGRGASLLARLFSLSVIGDLVSVELAERRGVDPFPIDRLEDFKRNL